MTARTKSKSRQWTVWLCVALALLAVYVILSRSLFGSVTWDPFDPRLHRLAIPLVAFFFYVAWNTRWDGVRREKARGNREQGNEKVKVEGQGQQRNSTSCAAEPLTGGHGTVRPTAGQPVDATACRVGKETPDSSLTRQAAASTVEAVRCQPQSQPSTSALTGEELFGQARALPHQIIPDFYNDAPYLDLLAKSAQKGYAPALAKLGEYAMRRAAWVEAYYWMKQAQRNGMSGLAMALREIRKNWSQEGFPEQYSNVNQLFTFEAGSIGRALLRVDSGHESALAREFLRKAHPEFLEDCRRTSPGIDQSLTPSEVYP